MRDRSQDLPTVTPGDRARTREPADLRAAGRRDDGGAQGSTVAGDGPNVLARRREPEPVSVESLERNILRVETLLVVLATASIATADYFVGTGLSLGPLYLIPVSYSALTHRLPTTLGLLAVCVLLRQLLGPLGNAADPWIAFGRDLLIASLFLLPVVFLRRLGGQRRRMFELARQQRDELAREAETAGRLQRRLIALNQLPEGAFDIAALSEPLRAAGGDYYDFIDLRDRRCGIVVADVAGKGLPAALLMPAVRFGIRSVVAGQGTPAERIRQLNREFVDTTETRQYVTLVYTAIDFASGRITYVNAGHVPPLMVDADGRCRRLDRGGPPVGLLEGSDYECGEVTLEPGGVLLFYTDGINEAESPNGEEYGIERLARALIAQRERRAAEILGALFEEVHAFLDGIAPRDDITAIVVKRPR